MFQKLKKRTKEDEGNAIIVLGLMLIMALLLVGGLLLDVSKAHQMKSSYIDAARKSTQAAVMEQSTTGHLRVESVGALIKTYEHIARPSVVNPDGYFSKCANSEDVILNVYMGKDDGSGKSDKSELVATIKRGSVGESDSVEQITQKMNWIIGKNDVIGQYTSIELVVVEGTENVILPSAFKISGNKDEDKYESMSCQEMTIGAKANIFTEMPGNGN